MRVWIINPYGNLPGEGWRDYRSTMLAQALVRAGHQAVWWVSNFEHRSKRFRTTGFEEREVSPGFWLNIVPALAYSSNVSLGRIRSERRFAANFAALARNCPAPDAIVLADPALFSSPRVAGYARKFGVKLVVDVLDLWPELFSLILPKPLAWAERALFYPLYRRRARLFGRACGVVAVSRDYLAIAEKAAPRTRGAVAYLGVDNAQFEKAAGRHELLDTLALPEKKPGDLWVIYAGTLGVNYDIGTILDCAFILQKKAPQVRIIIAGAGPLESLVQTTVRERQLDNLTFLGSVLVDPLSALYRRCDLALSTYRGRSTVAMPVKVFDYLAAGLPVINSLGRDCGRLIESEGLGVQYEAENPLSLCDAILSLASDQSVRSAMKDKLKAASATFDSVVQHDRMVKFIEAVVQ